MADLTGIILAGGKSSRFNSPKYLAEINGLTLLEIAINKLKPFCTEFIVVSKCSVSRETEHFKRPKIKYVIEKDKRFHPLIGIKAGLESSKSDSNIVLAVDMPFVSKKLIKGLIPSLLTGESQGEGVDICLYRYKGRPEPLFGFYSKACSPVITNLLDGQHSTLNGQRLRIIDILEECKHKYINIKEDRLDFFNINTKEDLIEAQRFFKDNPKILSN